MKKKIRESDTGSCQNRRNLKSLNAYNSKTRVHKLMKLCALRDGNKLHLMIESSLQLILYKKVIKKLEKLQKLQRLIPKCCQKSSDPISFILIVAHYLVYNSKKIGSETFWQYIENWHCWLKNGKNWKNSMISQKLSIVSIRDIDTIDSWGSIYYNVKSYLLNSRKKNSDFSDL